MSSSTLEPAAPAAPPAAAPENATPAAPVVLRSAALGVLAVLASVVMLRWARAVFIPVFLGIMLSYALTPFVNRLERWRVPRVVGASVLLLGIICGMGSLLYSFSDDTAALIESLPDAAQKLRMALQDPRPSSPNALDNVKKTAAELQRAADENAAPATPAPPGVTSVVIERPRINIRDYLWSGTVGLVSLIGESIVVILLAFFMLASGDAFRRKLVKLAGPSMSRKRITVEALDQIAQIVQRYLLAHLFTSALVGIATWVLFAWIGLRQPAVWGLAAGITNLIPYLGAVILGVSATLVAFMQFGSLETAFLVGGTSFVVHGIAGSLLSPWLTGRVARMSPVTVFVSVLAWGWLWGVWGLLLGVPVLVVVKAVCDRVDDLKPVGEFLGA